MEELERVREAWRRIPSDHDCQPVQRERYQRAKAALEATGWDEYTVRWRWRRQVEDRALVGTWARVFADLDGALEDPLLKPR